MSRRSVLGLVCLAVTLAGCSGTDYGPLGEVSGKLTMDGKPLATGTQLLFMQMEAGHAGFAATDAEGNYSITWAREGERVEVLPAGVYKVLIQPPAGGGDPEELSAEDMLAGRDAPLVKPSFPKLYQQHSTSGLEFTVEEGENTINIDLKSNAK